MSVAAAALVMLAMLLAVQWCCRGRQYSMSPVVNAVIMVAAFNKSR
jgi:hypothetical protein